MVYFFKDFRLCIFFTLFCYCFYVFLMHNKLLIMIMIRIKGQPADPVQLESGRECGVLHVGVTQVLECSWDELLHKVKNAEDLDHIIAAHQEFLDAITARALLDPQSHVSDLCCLMCIILFNSTSCFSFRSLIQQQQLFYSPLSGSTWVNRYQKNHSLTHMYPDHQPSFFQFPPYMISFCLQCFDAVGWVAGRASSL